LGARRKAGAQGARPAQATQVTFRVPSSSSR
jgi:hypothetical protein